LPLTNSYSPIPLSLIQKFADVSTSTICGNGTVESGETCDDGVNNGTVGQCSSDCLYIGEVRFTGKENISSLESNALLSDSLQTYEEIGDVVS
jgi:cysteine-rich repeat protein